MSIWTRASTWTKVKDTVQGAAAILQVVLVANESAHVWNYITAAVQIITLFVTIWGEDRDKDGTVDVFQKEVTVTVKSDAPITTEVTETKKD